MRRLVAIVVLALVVALWALILTAGSGGRRLTAVDSPAAGSAKGSGDGTAAGPGTAGADDATIDEKFAAIGRQVPGFGGAFYGDDRTLYIYLADPSLQAAAERALIATLGPTLPAGDRVEVLSPEYTFLQLKQWYDQMRDIVWSIPGVALTSIDERANRIRIGIGFVEGKAQLEAALKQLGIPSAAVILEIPEHPISLENPLADCRLNQRPSGDATSRPVGLKLSRRVVSPGAQLSLTVVGVESKLVTRGISAFFECDTDVGWVPKYVLYLDNSGASRKPRAMLYNPMSLFPDVGLGGAGPEPVQLPADLLPGWYRIRKDVSILNGDRSVRASPWALIEVVWP